MTSRDWYPGHQTSMLKGDSVSDCDCSIGQLTLRGPCCRFSGKGCDLGGGGRGGVEACLEKSALAETGETGSGILSARQNVNWLSFNLKLQAEMWWTVHLEGGPRRVNHAAVAMGERVFSFGDHNENIFTRNVEHECFTFQAATAQGTITGTKDRLMSLC